MSENKKMKSSSMSSSSSSLDEKNLSEVAGGGWKDIFDVIKFDKDEALDDLADLGSKVLTGAGQLVSESRKNKR